MKKTIAVSLLVVLAAGLTGCSQGKDANTTIQGETGSGTKLTAGLVEVEALTIVASEDGSTGAVSGVIVNSGAEADSLERISVDGTPATLKPASAPLPPGLSVKVESGSAVSAEVPLEAAAGTYVDVALDFANSGRVNGNVLVVPPVSFYEPAAPAGSAPATPAGPAGSAPATPAAPASSAPATPEAPAASAPAG